MKDKAEILISQIDTKDLISWQWEISENETDQIGGGTLPGVEIPAFAVTLLRSGIPSIITRLKKGSN